MRALKCPFAIQTVPAHATHGEYPDRYPVGAVVHYSAGKTASSALQVAGQRGFAYWVIDSDGAIYQTHPLDRWGHHAGESYWPSLGADVSRFLLGIEVICPGLLTWTGNRQYATWYRDRVPLEYVREVARPADNVNQGAYEAMTAQAEFSLEQVIQWLARQAPGHFAFDTVLGHDEVAPKRKSDPGGSLSQTMPDFRSYLFKRRAAWRFI